MRIGNCARITSAFSDSPGGPGFRIWKTRLLFLYNQPGKLLRIRPTPTDAEPFELEAVFTTDIPNDDHPVRVWLDPAGRIDFITDDNLLTVAFPAGHIPKEISQMMVEAKP